ncbi:hypothetical protein [Levilinea saccharolytica]|uniref:hypothetical protein n=1 Tax=Levilinea saccharolytica TaxID=229921 RepID=UPI0011BF6229|nr:hypothetical protein [Levilinea saccharolytica]
MDLPAILLWIIGLSIAIPLDWVIVRKLTQRWYQYKTTQQETNTIIEFGGTPSPFLTWFSGWKNFAISHFQRIRLAILQRNSSMVPHSVEFEGGDLAEPPKKLSWMMTLISRTRDYFKTILGIYWNVILEIILIIIWALFIGRSYLDFSPNTLPGGNELPHLTQSHLIWRLLPICGSCVLWNGQVNGGAPAFVETSGAPLHPLVILTTLIWGVFNGSKVIALVSLMIAGLGQWGLARALKLGWLPRIWSALLAVAGGHLAAKMENGMLLGLLSTASASLILPALVNLLWNGNRRSAVWLGFALALTGLSGEGYIQIGTVIGILPPAVLLLWDKNWKLKMAWRDLALAFLLAFLLLGVFWAPLIHFSPNYVKDGDDTFSNYVPLAHIPLNLVLSDGDYYHMSILGKDGLVYTHAIFIGWIPVLFALASLRFVPKKGRPVMVYFWVSILLLFVICSSEFAHLIYPILPGFKNLRHLSPVTGLAVPYLLGLAAWSIDRILKKVKTPAVLFPRSNGTYYGIPVFGLVLLLVLLYSLKPPYEFGRQWLNNWNLQLPPSLIESLSVDSAAWVTPPDGEFQWIPVLLEKGFKLGQVWRPWFWKDRSFPPALYTITNDPNYSSDAAPIASFAHLRTFYDPAIEYAAVQTEDGSIPCAAEAAGGWIDVVCQNAAAGKLLVYENQWSGWKAWRDGQPQPLLDNQWLSVTAPAGKHHYSFRYQPWDVPLGLLFTLCGFGMAIWMLRRT